MVMLSQGDCLTGITAETDMQTEEDLNCLSDPEKRLCLELGKETRSLFGDDSLTIAGNRELIAPSSETSPSIFRASLCDRLTLSLISSGLVCGIIPMSMRNESDQRMLDFASRPQAGNDADKLKTD